MPIESMSYIFFIVIIFGASYFFLMGPQRKQAKIRQQMLDSITVGQEIITIGGFYGTITAMDGDKIKVKIAENMEVTMLLSAVRAVVNPVEPTEEVTEEPMEEVLEDTQTENQE